MTFEFKNDDKNFKKKWVSHAGTCWRSFKSRLTRDYIRKPKPGLERPWVRYNYLSKKVWKKFAKAHRSEKFLVSTSLIYLDNFMLMIYRY